MWTQIRLLLSDLSQHCLLERLLKHFSRWKKQTNFVAIGSFRANCLMFCFQAQPWICIWTESGEPLHLPIFDHLRSSPWEDCSIYINMAWYILISNVSDSIVIWNERGMKFPTMWYVDQLRLRPACAYAQTDQSLCWWLKYSMTVKLLTQPHLRFLSLKGGCIDSSESALVKMPHCWKSHVTAQIYLEEHSD